MEREIELWEKNGWSKKNDINSKALHNFMGIVNSSIISVIISCECQKNHLEEKLFLLEKKKIN